MRNSSILLPWTKIGSYYWRLFAVGGHPTRLWYALEHKYNQKQTCQTFFFIHFLPRDIACKQCTMGEVPEEVFVITNLLITAHGM